MLSALYINGEWRAPSEPREIAVFNPATEEVLHHVLAGGPRDVDTAVAAAHEALPGWSQVGGNVRSKFLQAIAAKLRERAEELAVLSSQNNGKPLSRVLKDSQRIGKMIHSRSLIRELDDVWQISIGSDCGAAGSP